MVLRKLGKLDYLDLAIYYLIALLNTLDKMLESIIIGRISTLIEQYSLLLDKQYRVRSRRLIENALLNL